MKSKLDDRKTLKSLELIIKELEKDSPKVVVIIGAGISVGATAAPQASWLGLLKHGVNYLVDIGSFTQKRGEELNTSLNDAFQPFNLDHALDHAELVELNLKITRLDCFKNWLEAAFGNLTISRGADATIDAIRDLQQAGALLLTTNYDGLLTEATGLLPVTWEDRSKFHQVMTRQINGILHIHGHWQRPSSVVLGRTSYARVVDDSLFQDLLKSLWLEYSWVYVGCGDGLDDPNLGRLMEWSKNWGLSSLKDYFLAKSDKAFALESNPDKPTNLVSIGYSGYSDLPVLLSALTPTARYSPFVPVDEEFALFRSTGSSVTIPFPSRQEYLDGEVPALSADAEVDRRLNEHGWAFVLDVASTGKTTLALRIATQPDQRNHPVFYLDIANIDADHEGSEVRAALGRLMRQNVLLILDNVHHQPELVRHLWDQWRGRTHGSKLLLIGTRIQQAVTTSPAQDLSFFSNHTTNPSIELRPDPDDLKNILKGIAKRVDSKRVLNIPEPPDTILKEWHKDYGSALGAFCLATVGLLARFQHGNWNIPPEAATNWVRDKWLKHLDSQNRENLLCLAVFGEQDLELLVPDDALPHHGKIEQISALGLILRSETGQFAQYHRFRLREPGWGQLILAAQKAPVNTPKILFETAERHPFTALVLSSRLKRKKNKELYIGLWQHLASMQDKVAKRASELPLSYFSSFVRQAVDNLAMSCWDAIEREPGRLAERAWETPLHFVASFLDTAKRHGRNPDPLWDAIEREPGRLAETLMKNTISNMVNFFHHAPATVINKLLNEFKPDRWNEFQISESFRGVSWIAYRCAEVGHEDHKMALVTMMLQRANPNDFPPAGGFHQAAWILKSTSFSSGPITKFLDELCTKKWLGWQYSKATCTDLAAGLMLLALSQPNHILKRFYNIGLGIRINNELRQFNEKTPEQKSHVVRLLGSATLCRWLIQADWFKNVPLEEIGKLPVDALPHRPDSTKIDKWQSQLWIGLRAIASITQKQLAIDLEIISQTLTLWRSNLSEAEVDTASVEYKVNQSMVAWLETCLKTGCLVPLE